MHFHGTEHILRNFEGVKNILELIIQDAMVLQEEEGQEKVL